MFFSLHIHSMWETICDAKASWSGWKFGSNIQFTLFWDLVPSLPPPPKIYWNVGRSWQLNMFSHMSAKAKHGLSSLSCVWMYVDQNQGTTLPPRNGISTGNSLISSPDLDSPQKFILDWYLFLNGCLQITLIQIYFWYYKTIWGHFNNGCLFLLQTTQPIRMQGQQKILPPAGEEGHSSNEDAW